MKKIIRSTNDLLLAVLMGGLSIFLLLSKKIITGVENGLGGHRPRQAHQQHPSGRVLRADQGHPDGPCDRGYEEEQL